MIERVDYQGDGIGLVDDKGRCAIPASLRAAIAANSPRADGKDGGNVIIGAHQTSPCLIGYDDGYRALLKERAGQLQTAYLAKHGTHNPNIMREMVQGEPVPFDGSGRFIMPAFARFRAKIGANAFFYGTFECFEIWDPRTLIESDVAEVMKDCARFHCQQKGIAL